MPPAPCPLPRPRGTTCLAPHRDLTAHCRQGAARLRRVARTCAQPAALPPVHPVLPVLPGLPGLLALDTHCRPAAASTLTKSCSVLGAPPHSTTICRVERASRPESHRMHFAACPTRRCRAGQQWAPQPPSPLVVGLLLLLLGFS